MVPNDGGHLGPRQADQVGRRELELETAAAGRHEHGRMATRTGVDDDRERPARSERADPTDDRSGCPFGGSRLHQLSPSPVRRRGEGLEVELPRDRDDGHDQSPVDARDEGLVHPIGVDAQGLGGRQPVCRPTVTIATVPLGRLVGVDMVRDPGPPNELERGRTRGGHGSIVAISAMLRAVRYRATVAPPPARPATGAAGASLTFDTLGLSADLLQTVSEEGYRTPTPVQAGAIPLVLQGRDLLAAAQTGTGKTAAFVLPILDRMRQHANTSFSPARHPVRVLILVPTRELAMQVDASVRTYGRTVPLRSTVVYGGIPIEPQIKALRAGVEILVATPGRLLDHVGQRTVNLGSVEILVLDEADRMLDMGFLPDIRRILELLPARRQNLLFSATFSQEIRDLSRAFLTDPATVEVAPRNTAAEAVQQLVYPVDRDRKEALLAHLIRKDDLRQVLVFTRTKLAASRLAARLDRDGLDAVAIHSDRSQPERTRALEGFKTGEIRVLVATDVAARGLDIEDLPVVVNFELPWNPQDYIHRIGRTGRAGATGEAISLVCIDETDLLRGIQKMLRMAIPWTVEEGYIPDRNAEPRPLGARAGHARVGSEHHAQRKPVRRRVGSARA
jgi:ATP-dependent RNA helicase RhlE